MEAVAQRSPVAINNILRILLLVLTAGLIGVVGYNLRDTTISEGDKAPAFSVHTDQGQTLSPTNFGGKVLVLNFWATWCPPCISETPSLNAFQRKYRDKGVVVLGVSVDKNEEKYKRFVARFRLGFQTVRDPAASISADYSTFQYPETYIIKDGRVIRKYVSDQNWMSDEISRYIESLL